jgi:dTMP kinase
VYKPLNRNSLGLFITLDGVDGVSKTTQAELLYNYLKLTFGDKVISVKELGGIPETETLRNILLFPETPWDPMTEILLYAAARREIMSKVIIPKLNEGYIVICDRFVDSAVAYGQYGLQVTEEYIDMAIDLSTENIDANVTFILTAPDEVCRSRLSDKKLDRFESMDAEFKNRISAYYDSIEEFDMHHVCVYKIDATPSIEEIHLNMVTKLEKTINLFLEQKWIKTCL